MGRKLTKEDVNKRLSNGIVMTGQYDRSYTKSEFECSENHRWLATPSSVLRGNGCPHCSGKAPLSKDIINNRLLDRNIVMIGGYTNNYTLTEFECIDDHRWYARPANVLNGNGCPFCSERGFNPDKPASVYGFVRDGYLKVGITNDLKQRLRTHRRYGEFDLIYEKYYSSGRDAQIFELNFKKSHCGKFVSKEKCPDGWTETFPLHLIKVLTGDK